MQRKIDVLRELMEAGDWRSALALAARFPRLGEHRTDIVRGHEAFVHPAFYAQLRMDPHELIARGIAALKHRYGSPTSN